MYRVTICLYLKYFIWMVHLNNCLVFPHLKWNIWIAHFDNSVLNRFSSKHQFMFLDVPNYSFQQLSDRKLKCFYLNVLYKFGTTHSNLSHRTRWTSLNGVVIRIFFFCLLGLNVILVMWLDYFIVSKFILSFKLYLM